MKNIPVGVAYIYACGKKINKLLNLNLFNSTIILETFAANSLNAFQIIK